MSARALEWLQAVAAQLTPTGWLLLGLIALVAIVYGLQTLASSCLEVECLLEQRGLGERQ